MVRTIRLSEFPWGIVAAVSAMIFSFSLIAVIVLYAVGNALMVDGSGNATIFDTWYQTLLFVLTLLSGAGCIAATVMRIIFGKKRVDPWKELKDAECAAKSEGEEK